MPRQLEPEELALWQRVTATVRPLASPRAPLPAPVMLPRPPSPPRPARAGPSQPPSETLDAGWDRRLARGKARPERVVDLHGLSRQQARETLITAIDRAERKGERLLLVITGKGASPGPAPADLAEGRPVRGAIRADLPRWLGEAHVSARIAAVRRAHPRDGGEGAVYLILKRRRMAR